MHTFSLFETKFNTMYMIFHVACLFYIALHHHMFSELFCEHCFNSCLIFCCITETQPCRIFRHLSYFHFFLLISNISMVIFIHKSSVFLIAWKWNYWVKGNTSMISRKWYPCLYSAGFYKAWGRNRSYLHAFPNSLFSASCDLPPRLRTYSLFFFSP